MRDWHDDDSALMTEERPQSTTSSIRIERFKELDMRVTEVNLTEEVQVGTMDGYLCFWCAGREVRIGPLTSEQAELIAEDLAYEAI